MSRTSTSNKNGNWFLWRGLAALVLVGLLIVGGLAVYRMGWSEGYAAGQLTAEGEESATAPYGPPGSQWLGRPLFYPPFMSGAGVLLRVILLVLLLGLMGKLLRFIVWGIVGAPAMAGAWAHHWRRPHWHRFHGPMPPGYHGWYGWPEEAGGKPEPGAQADEAAA